MTKRFKIQTKAPAASRGSWFLRLTVIVSFAVLLLSLFFSPSFAASEIYKWKDKNGNVIFSDSPPSGSNAEEVRIKNNMRFDIPPSKEADAPKAGKGNAAPTKQRLRDVRDIHVVMYMTDW
ncbi:MAG: hypothetical protein H6Q93_1486 [Nitrospirae bacterium]|nr:hypothetical protein [Nitrospirota bacterium]